MATRPDAIVIAQVAVAVVVLVGAGLLVRSLGELQGTGTGFRTQNVVAAQVSLPRATHDIVMSAQVSEAIRTELEALPGVEFATVWGPNVPLNAGVFEGSYAEGAVPEDDEPALARYHLIRADGLDALDIPVIRGRGITAEDRPGTLQAVVVSECCKPALRPLSTASKP